MPVPSPIADLVTLREIAGRVGSYYNAYNLACSGTFGAPVAVIGRTQLFDRAAVDVGVSTYLAKRARAGRAA